MECKRPYYVTVASIMSVVYSLSKRTMKPRSKDMYCMLTIWDGIENIQCITEDLFMEYFYMRCVIAKRMDGSEYRSAHNESNACSTLALHSNSVFILLSTWKRPRARHARLKLVLHERFTIIVCRSSHHGMFRLDWRAMAGSPSVEKTLKDCFFVTVSATVSLELLAMIPVYTPADVALLVQEIGNDRCKDFVFIRVFQCYAVVNKTACVHLKRCTDAFSSYISTYW